MRRIQQSCDELERWMATFNINLEGVKIEQTEWGSGIVASRALDDGDGALLQIPSALVLSQSYIQKQAETDSHLRDCLDALGEFTQTARGAILVFLLLQISATSPDVPVRIGVENAWTTYVQYLTSEANLPTFWTEDERRFCEGTTLGAALEAKLDSLQREFDLLANSLREISWCQKYWFENGQLSIDDWKTVDSIYRSRAMELPVHGLCMVPIADMANHAHGSKVNSRIDVDPVSGAVRLIVDHQGESIDQGTELTITYGDDKGACEMLFSYGFIDHRMEHAQSMFLELHDPDDDPIFMAKRIAFDCAPGVRINYKTASEHTKWFGAFVWLMCINEEDGLELSVVHEPPIEGDDDRSSEPTKRLVASWKGRELQNVVDLDNTLQNDEMADLFRLRGSVIVHERVKTEIKARGALLQELTRQDWWTLLNRKSMVWKNTKRLRSLEWQMLKDAEQHLVRTIGQLYSSPIVKKFFNHSAGSEDMWSWYQSRGEEQHTLVKPTDEDRSK